MRFTARIAASKGQRTLVLDDAPRPTRVGYIKSILPEFVATQSSTRRGRDAPLETTETHQAFIVLIRDEAEPWDYDEQSAWGALTHHVKECSWTEFFDFVELVGKLLQKHDDGLPFDHDETFPVYQSKVNTLLLEDGIGWSLNDKAELHRPLPRPLSTPVEATDGLLVSRFATARIHYQKATQYLYQHPIDEANAVKEIVSALESVAKKLCPKTATLGDALKVLRKRSAYPAQILDAIEKLYIYSNATPLIRHGHDTVHGPGVLEAEFCFLLGVASIRYLIEAEKRGC